MRQNSMVERALAANHKTQIKGNFLKNYPPCQHYDKNGHPPFKCQKRRDAQRKIYKQFGPKSKSNKDEVDAQITNEEEDDHLFVPTYFSTRKYDFE